MNNQTKALSALGRVHCPVPLGERTGQRDLIVDTDDVIVTLSGVYEVMLYKTVI